MSVEKLQLSKLEKSIECSVCLQPLQEPKHLLCGHTFCKVCVDSLLDFKEDGAATLRCPNKCKKETRIESPFTTACLTTNFTLQNVLDALDDKTQSEKEKQLAVCQFESNCKRTTTRSCTVCSLKCCKTCWEKHLCANKSYTSVIFDKRSDSLQPHCVEHDSVATSVCLDCRNEFLCVYYKSRDHRYHNIDSIEHRSSRVRKNLIAQVETVKQNEDIQDELGIKYDNGLNKIFNYRKVLVRELQERKLKRMEQYLLLLDKESHSVLVTFDEAVKDFQLNLDGLGFLKNTTLEITSNKSKRNESEKILGMVKVKEDFEIVAEKSELETQLKQINTPPYTVPSFSAKLTSMDMTGHANQQLGNLLFAASDKQIIKMSLTNSYGTTSSVLKTIDELQSFLKGVTPLPMKIEAVDENNPKRKEGESFSQNVDQEKSKYLTKTYTFEDLEKLLKNSTTEQLTSIFVVSPYLVNIRKLSDERSLLMVAAAHNNVPMVKLLISFGIDVWAASKEGYNAYHLSAMNGHYEALDILLKHDDKNINKVNLNLETPFFTACWNGHLNVVRLLLQRGVNTLVYDVKGITAADIAGAGINRNNREKIQRLISEYQVKMKNILK